MDDHAPGGGNDDNDDGTDSEGDASDYATDGNIIPPAVPRSDDIDSDSCSDDGDPSIADNNLDDGDLEDVPIKEIISSPAQHHQRTTSTTLVLVCYSSYVLYDVLFY